MARVGAVLCACVVALVLASVSHYAMWGYLASPPEVELSCSTTWSGSVLTTGRPESLEFGRLPREFDQLLARHRPRGALASAAVHALVEVVERESVNRVCALLSCSSPKQHLVACLVPVAMAADRYRFSVASFGEDLALIDRASSWYSDVGGLEVLTLPVLFAGFTVVSLGVLMWASAIRASRLPK